MIPILGKKVTPKTPIHRGKVPEKSLSGFNLIIWNLSFLLKSPPKVKQKSRHFSLFLSSLFFLSRAYGKIEPPLELRKAVKKFFRESYENYENENWIKEQIKTHNSSTDVKPFCVTHWVYLESTESGYCSEMMRGRHKLSTLSST